MRIREIQKEIVREREREREREGERFRNIRNVENYLKKEEER